MRFIELLKRPDSGRRATRNDPRAGTLENSGTPWRLNYPRARLQFFHSVGILLEASGTTLGTTSRARPSRNLWHHPRGRMSASSEDSKGGELRQAKGGISTSDI
jgi:hypothetical protein